MEDKAIAIMQMVLNDPNNLKILNQFQSPFRPYTKNPKLWGQPILKGTFFSYQKQLKRFKPYYFEVMTNIIFQYDDQSKNGPVEFLECHECYLKQDIKTIQDVSIFCLIFQTEQEIAKIWTQKHSLFILWRKLLRKYCQLQNFNAKYQVEEKSFNHIYRIVDQKKQKLGIAKIINKKGLRKDQIELINSEIIIMKRSTKCMLPSLKRIYEDSNYIYLVMNPFLGEDLMKICSKLKLEEPSIASITFHVLKALSRMHTQQFFHGNLKLENIVFIPAQTHNEILILNIKYSSRISAQYREQQVKNGNNFYVAPEVLKGDDITEGIDLYALGVCIFFMIFQKFPYEAIKQKKSSPYYEYTTDINCIDELLEAKKKNPMAGTSSISVSGLDLLKKLLIENPKERINAVKALSHHWFINLINQPKENKKLQKFKEMHQMKSLNTILECSEKDDMSMAKISTFLLQDFEIDEEQDKSEDSESNISLSSDEQEVPNLDKKLLLLKQLEPKFGSSIREQIIFDQKNELQQNFKTSYLQPNVENDEEFKYIRKTKDQTLSVKV